MNANIIILIPVYNDWDSLQLLLGKLPDALKSYPSGEVAVLVVNDGSTDALPAQKAGNLRVYCLQLNRNIGHQKAIATGLSYIYKHAACQKVLVMDADGEDQPQDALALLNEARQKPDKIVFAHRAGRNEDIRFKLFYWLYKLCFILFTGRRISYGNFAVIPRSLLEKLVFYSEIWNHIPGGILKSKLPYTAVSTTRGKRLAGNSKMNFTSLLLHGLGAIAVFMDIISVRLLIVSITMISLSVLAIIGIFLIKTIYPEMAIPGWASTLVSSMFIILLQGFLISLFTLFLYLSSQSQRKFIPAAHFEDYVAGLEEIK
jgi:polyisoprenyl-phosphate glycosyltransferase